MTNIETTPTNDDEFEGMKGMPVNKCFINIHYEFMEHGWTQLKHKEHLLLYSKNGGIDEFIIKMNSLTNKIETTVPLVGTSVSYFASFMNYNDACNHLYNHINIYESYYKDTEHLTYSLNKPTSYTQFSQQMC